jgi:Mg2+/Co2+ transporter CorB
VDEYGDIQGLVTLDEILEEIVGDFTAHTMGKIEDVHPQSDGSYLIRGTVSLRDLNRQLDWKLPTDDSRTLNGLIVEYLEDIPAAGTSLMIHGYLVEILRTRGTAIEVARVRPAIEPVPETSSASSE